MRVKHLALACVALLAWIIPARADVILTYHLSTFVPANPANFYPPGTQIPTNDPLGPALTGPGVINPNSPTNPLVFVPGQVRFIQVAIQANAVAPTMIAGQDQANWTPSGGGSGNTMTTFGFVFHYPLALVTQPIDFPIGPFLNYNTPSSRAQSGPQPDGSVPGYQFSTGYPITYPGYNMGGTAMTGTDNNAGLGTSNFTSNGINVLSDTNLAVFKIIAGNNLGSGVITMADLNTSPASAQFGLLDGTNLDTLIFSLAHGGPNAAFPLYIQVVPEPSSLVLAGLAMAGFGWRRLRKKSSRSPIV
jgi:hypothetical protein